jgi:hypothetical protein
MRPVRLFLLPLLIVALPSIAHADDTINGGVPLMEIRIPKTSGDGYERILPGGTDRRFEHQFNEARCLCAADGIDDKRTRFAIHTGWTTEPETPPTEDIQIWTGTGCDTADAATRATTCGDGPKDTTNYTEIRSAADLHLTTIQLIDAAEHDPPSCGPLQQDMFVYFVYNPSGSATFDSVVTSEPIHVDTTLPDAPTRFTAATGGEEALTVSWPTGSTSSGVFYYQALCAKVDDTAAAGVVPAFETPPAKARYETYQGICDGDQPPLIDVAPVGTSDVDAGVPDVDGGAAVDLPAGLANLEAKYVCGEATATESTIRIEGLENGAEYYVVLVAVDEAGNARGITPGFTVSPEPATDFWEDLHDNGSNAKGGFCLIADTYGDGGGPGGAITAALRDFRDQTLASSSAGRALTRFYYAHVAGAGELARGHAIARIGFALALLPLVAVALLWHLLTLPGLLAVIALMLAWRRIAPRLRGQRGLVGAAAGIAMIVVGARSASAQSFAPYWDDGTDVTSEPGPENVRWHVGVKLGPYLPGIDEQLGAGAGNGPYHAFFGGYNILPILEVDYVVWHPPGGQLAIGGSGGVLGKTGQALDLMGRPSEGDETKFRLLPLALTAAYRFTWLDDELGIPVVPYLRGGLAYYVWWITKPNGDLAVDGMDNKARGATMGLVGSAGLAVRAEKIDPAAAASMRDSGIYHAGFYGEYQVAWVDGFGSEDKLAVGDNTWFAGVDFEF